jgi:hypothetical protein
LAGAIDDASSPDCGSILSATVGAHQVMLRETCRLTAAALGKYDEPCLDTALVHMMRCHQYVFTLFDSQAFGIVGYEQN